MAADYNIQRPPVQGRQGFASKKAIITYNAKATCHKWCDYAGYPSRNQAKLQSASSGKGWIQKSECMATVPHQSSMQEGNPNKKLSHKARDAVAGPWHTISSYVMGPFRKIPGGKTSLLVIADMCTRWIEPFLGETRTSPITRLIEGCIFMRFGYPQILISYTGS